MEWPEELPNAKVKSNLSRNTPQDIPIPAEPTLNFNPRLREYLEGRTKDPPVGARNVYGTERDIEWDWNVDEAKWYEKEGGPKQRPIQGPLHWYSHGMSRSGLWQSWQDIGNDITLTGNMTNPLHPTQTQMMNEHSPDLRVIQWVKRLGSGNFGEVWRVRYHKSVLENIEGTDTAERVDTIEEGACKVMRLKVSYRTRAYDVRWAVDEMMADFYALRYLKHENIMSFDGVINIPDSQTRFPYSTILLLLEICDGDLMRQVKDLLWAANVQIPIEMCRKWMRDLTKAVHYLHSNNVIHLDIKPHNILYKWQTPGTLSSVANIVHRYDEMTFKLGDLGAAKSFPIENNILSPSRITDMVNTAMYSSPEANALKKTKGTRVPIEGKPCDIYCIGASLAVMVMDVNDYKDHYKARNVYKYIQDMASGQVIGHNIPQEVLDLLLRLIHPDWTQRPTSDQLLNDPWLKVEEKKEQSDTKGTALKKRKLDVLQGEEEEDDSDDQDDQGGQGPPKRQWKDWESLQ